MEEIIAEVNLARQVVWFLIPYRVSFDSLPTLNYNLGVLSVVYRMKRKKTMFSLRFADEKCIAKKTNNYRS